MNSPVLKWPDRTRVAEAASAWARQQRRLHPELVRLGYFGSYARGDWGVGSDLDLVAIVTESSTAFEQRPLDWDLSALPVPTEILVYTQDEWDRLRRKGGRFADTLQRESVWL